MPILLTTILGWIGKALPFLPIGKNDRVQEIEAETELVLARKGYIPPKALKKYAAIILAVIFLIWLLFVGELPMEKVKSVVDFAKSFE
ncbi:MAG: hypothetical protein LBO64_03345 [Desulfovibrio sp.]|jgi:hypothetical protein|nr:hypothetical protein [Desulfovibrio sp.]